MNENTVNTLIISNVVLLAFFVVQKIIEVILERLRKNQEKKDADVDGLKSEMNKVNLEMAVLKTQIKSIMEMVSAVGEIKQDLNVLFERLRNKK